MDQTVEHLVALWDHLDANFWRFWRSADARFRPDQVGWRPNPRVASIGWNLWHLAETLDHYLSRVFGRCAPAGDEPLLTMVPGGRDDGRFRELDAVAAYHRRVRPAYRAFLTDSSAADLATRLGDTGRNWGWAVGHIAEHESYHLGKCVLLGNLLPDPVPA